MNTKASQQVAVLLSLCSTFHNTIRPKCSLYEHNNFTASCSIIVALFNISQHSTDPHVPFMNTTTSQQVAVLLSLCSTFHNTIRPTCSLYEHNNFTASSSIIVALFHISQYSTDPHVPFMNTTTSQQVAVLMSLCSTFNNILPTHMFPL